MTLSAFPQSEKWGTQRPTLAAQAEKPSSGFDVQPM
jgi:hypothetical protein